MASPIPSRRPCITFLTDFGARDTYVGQMKGAALAICPDLQLVDLTHAISPQQILPAAYAWNDAILAFPPDTIHVAVIDPGVGSDRRIVAAEIGHSRFVCPDNGLLTIILRREAVRRVVHLDKPRWWRSSVSNTFHGRDIMAPVAAAWCLGHDLTEFGSPLKTPLITLPLADVVRGQSSSVGQVIDIDRFGNLMTNIERSDLPDDIRSLRVEIGGLRIDGLSGCYSDASEGEPIALLGSASRLEIAIRNGNAAEELQAGLGKAVVVRWKAAIN